MPRGYLVQNCQSYCTTLPYCLFPCVSFFCHALKQLFFSSASFIIFLNTIWDRCLMLVGVCSWNQSSIEEEKEAEVPKDLSVGRFKLQDPMTHLSKTAIWKIESMCVSKLWVFLWEEFKTSLKMKLNDKVSLWVSTREQDCFICYSDKDSKLVVSSVISVFRAVVLGVNGKEQASPSLFFPWRCCLQLRSTSPQRTRRSAEEVSRREGIARREWMVVGAEDTVATTLTTAVFHSPPQSTLSSIAITMLTSLHQPYIVVWPHWNPLID